MMQRFKCGTVEFLKPASESFTFPRLSQRIRTHSKRQPEMSHGFISVDLGNCCLNRRTLG